MTRLVWDRTAAEAGLDRGVLYLSENEGLPWNGLVSVTENAEDVVETDRYFDGIRYDLPQGVENFSATIESYTYPEELEEHIGLDGIVDKQSRKRLGLSYRTHRGGNVRMHLVYQALIHPSSRTRQTLQDSMEPTNFSWDISTIPIEIPGCRPGSHIYVDSEGVDPNFILSVENLIYGSSGTSPELPEVQTLIDLTIAYAGLLIVDHGDGTWTAIGNDNIVKMLDATTFEISWPSVIYLDDDTYNVSTL